MDEKEKNEVLRGVMLELRESVKRGHWFEIGDESAGVLLEYIEKLEAAYYEW